MEALKLILAGLGCFGLLIVGSCTMLGMAGAQMIDKAVELEKTKQAERASGAGADSSRFGADARYESASANVPYQEHSAMDKSDWKFGDPNVDATKR
jgi:hypothetical protein